MNSLKVFGDIIAAKVVKRKTPLTISLRLTNQCNATCKYCDIWKIKPQKEMTTNQVLKVIDELADLGCGHVDIVGGEPLLRNDIGEIVDYFAQKNIVTTLVTNGLATIDKLDQIKKVSSLVFSLDGPEELHEANRPKGSFRKTINSIKEARKRGFVVSTNTVINKFNVDSIDYVLQKAKELDFVAFFQPVYNYSFANFKEAYFPEKEKFQAAIKKIIIAKNKKDLPIGNTNLCLKFFEDWPNFKKKLKCWAGVLYFVIDYNGNLYASYNDVKKVQAPNILKMGLSEALTNIQKPVCKGCWTGVNIEFNYLMAFKVESILNTIKLKKMVEVASKASN